MISVGVKREVSRGETATPGPVLQTPKTGPNKTVLIPLVIFHILASLQWTIFVNQSVPDESGWGEDTLHSDNVTRNWRKVREVWESLKMLVPE